jgi:hypothetical protein
MANHPPLPEWPVRVEVHPAPGWVRIPHDPRPQGRFIMVVLPPVETPMSPHSQGEVDYEELRRRAATKKIQGESDHAVQLVEFPWGRGYRSLSRRAHGQDPIDEAMTSIEYLIKGPVTPSTICVLGQVPATAAERTERLIGDIASMVSTLTVFVAPSD